MNPTEHEQIRAYFCERFPCETLTDDEIASLAKMPLVVRLCASGARSVDGFLRGLPDDLLTRVILLLHDFFEWSDREAPESWPVELHCVTTMLYHGEIGDDAITSDEEMGDAVVRLAALTLIERSRREEADSFVAPYSLASTREPLKMLAQESLTGH